MAVEFVPCVVEVSAIDSQSVEVTAQETTAQVSVTATAAQIMPYIPENYCRFEWDGTKLRFS